MNETKCPDCQSSNISEMAFDRLCCEDCGLIFESKETELRQYRRGLRVELQIEEQY